MRYDWTAIPDAEVPASADPVFAHLVATYASETNKTASMWRAVPDDLLEFRPHPKANTVRAILAHQLLSERRFFGQFVGTAEVPADRVLPPGDAPVVGEYVARYVDLARPRLAQVAAGSREWWLAETPFFGGLMRQRVWTFWRRVLHTAHHRTQVQSWLRLGGAPLVPAIYGPSGDVSWDGADPTTTVAAAGRST